MKKWKCAACSYQFSDNERPEKCPACGAGADMVVEVVEGNDETLKSEKKMENPVPGVQNKSEKAAGEKKWRCTICNYIHIGEEPPDECPVCGADKTYFVEVSEDEPAGEDKPADAGRPAAEKTGSQEPQSPKEKKPFGLLGSLVLRFHLHPISVHIPNGVLPAALVFLILAIFFQLKGLESASFFNLVFVLVTFPLVVITGYISWQRKYKGAKTFIFKAKLACSAIVAVTVSLLVFWRIIDPEIALSGGTGGWLYLALFGIALVAAAIAGSLGGRLVFGKWKEA
jgi:rubredoxin/uncharacterized membrane protein